MDQIRMRLDKIVSGYNNSGDQRTLDFLSLLGIVPFPGQIQCHTDIRILYLRSRHKRLGKHGNTGRIGSQCCHTFRMFRFIFDRQILCGIQSIRLQDIIKGIFRSGALPAGIQGLSLQIRHRLNGLTIFHDIKDTQRINCQYADLSFGIIIQHTGQIRGYSSDIEISLYNLRSHLIHSAMNRKFIPGSGSSRI